MWRKRHHRSTGSSIPPPNASALCHEG